MAMTSPCLQITEVLRQIAEDEPVDFPPEKIPELIQSP